MITTDHPKPTGYRNYCFRHPERLGNIRRDEKLMDMFYASGLAENSTGAEWGWRGGAAPTNLLFVIPTHDIFSQRNDDLFILVSLHVLPFFH